MRFFFLVFLFFTFASAENTPSDIKIRLGEAKTKKSLLAVPPLQYYGAPGSNTKYNEIGAAFYATLINDLTVSSFFQLIPQSAFLEDTSKTSLQPAPEDPKGFKFESWKQIETDFLIRTGFSLVGKTLTIECYMYHVPRSQMILQSTYKGPADSAEKLAHKYANDILKSLTGKEGMFLSKIVVASDRSGSKTREIYTMNWDGTNIMSVSNHKSIALSPAWSPDGKKIAYTAFVKHKGSKLRNADMLIKELETKKLYIVSFRQGLNSGAAFANDNQHLYLTISQGVSPDIFKINFDGKVVDKLTNGPSGAINVEPAICRSSGQIAFSSDRSERPMIYTMNADGSNVKRLTFAGVFNSSPSWSPDCKKIAFSGQSENHFDIFVMDNDGTNMLRLTSAKTPQGKWSNNEDPVFSPDGRFVMYTSNRTGKNQIFISTSDGSEERRVTVDNYNYYKPRWSNNIE